MCETTRLRGYTKKRVLIYYEDTTIKVVCFFDEAIWIGQGNCRQTELSTAGVTSPGDFEGYIDDITFGIDHLLADHNKEIDWTDNVHRGFIKLTLGREKAVASFIAVSNILSEQYEIETIRAIEIKKRDGELAFKPLLPT